MEISTGEELIIKTEIRKLMERYVSLADSKNWAGLSCLFSDEGIFETLNPAGELLVAMRGRTEIVSVITASVGRARVIQRLYSSEIKVIGAERASGIFGMSDTLIRPGDELPERLPGSVLPVFRTLHGFGHYHCDYIRVDGQWYIEKLVQTRTKLDFIF